MHLLKRMPWFHRFAILVCGALIAAVAILPKAETPQRTIIELASITPISPAVEPPPRTDPQPTALDIDTQNSDVLGVVDVELEAPRPTDADLDAKVQPEANAESLQTLVFTVEPGDTLSHLFDRARQTPNTLYRVLNSAPKDLERRLVRNLQPGNTFEFHLAEDALRGFTLWSSRLDGLRAEIDDNRTISHWETFTRDTVREVKWSRATINSSLFFAGRDAGLSETMTMNLAQLFGWDIDFALDIRKGDHFAMLYEELYLDGELVGEGNILAATFTNQGRTFNAIRYTDDTGRTSFFDEAGRSVRKAFLRTPVDIGRISSHFNPNRRHPILNTIRAHRGTDYAAPTGTPIRAAGDGRVLEARTNGGYGRMVLVQHGERIRTLYAHMSSYANGVRAGSTVRQGQVIGYVGMSGAATGPHLHYEFLVNGVHKNPVTVSLPDAEPINTLYREDFMQHAGTLLQHLESTRHAGLAPSAIDG